MSEERISSPVSTVTVATPEQMRELGRGIAGLLRAGDVVLLHGPLGAGKTVLAQGIGAGLGVTTPVTSPTFVLARWHEGRLPFVHVDAYRLRVSDAGIREARLELDDLDLGTSVADSVTVVEWGKALAEGLAADRLELTLTRPEEGDDRTVTITAYGARWAGVDLVSLVASLGAGDSRGGHDWAAAGSGTLPGSDLHPPSSRRTP